MGISLSKLASCCFSISLPAIFAGIFSQCILFHPMVYVMGWLRLSFIGMIIRCEECDHELVGDDVEHLYKCKSYCDDCYERWLRQPRKTREACLGSLFYRCGDVSDWKNAVALIEEAMKRFGRIDTLINTAAISEKYCQNSIKTNENSRNPDNYSVTADYLITAYRN